MGEAVHLQAIDYAIMAIYFAFTLGIGYVVKRNVRSSTDFFLAGRSMPTWVAGLAFISANLGAQEVIGMGASGAKYGLATCHFYWLAVPAMVFVGLMMMPFYYGSRARSVPEYLRLRFDEKTRALNAITFAVMTIFSSGVSMYAMGKLFYLLLGWNFHFSVLVSAVIVLSYVSLGGLTSAIYNEVQQFFFIVLGLAPLSWIGLRSVGGWSGLKARLAVLATSHGYAPGAYTHAWRYMGSAQQNPVGVEWIGLGFGLGFVLSFGYWCTDFLVVQRAMSARTQESARRVPILASVPKMIFPLFVILPGMIAAVATSSAPAQTPQPAGYAAAHARMSTMAAGLLPAKLTAGGVVQRDALGNVVADYDLATPMMLIHFFPSGMLGLGLTALLASFMSGMAGNVTAFNTVWTYDMYQAYLRPASPDRHYVLVGRWATVFGIALSVAAAYLAASFNNIMDLLQLVFAFVNAPLFATFALGMFWKRTTGHGAFFGLLAGMAGAALHHGLSLPRGAAIGVHGGFFSVQIVYGSDLAQAFWTAIAAFLTCIVVTVAVSLTTRPAEEKSLKGLVYSLTRAARIPTWFVVSAAEDDGRRRAASGAGAECVVLLTMSGYGSKFIGDAMRAGLRFALALWFAAFFGCSRRVGVDDGVGTAGRQRGGGRSCEECRDVRRSPLGFACADPTHGLGQLEPLFLRLRRDHHSPAGGCAGLYRDAGRRVYLCRDPGMHSARPGRKRQSDCRQCALSQRYARADRLHSQAWTEGRHLYRYRPIHLLPQPALSG